MNKYIYLITCFLYLSISALASPVQAAQRSGKTSITATIPASGNIRLFGYTAPEANVQAEGYRVFAQTISDANGYFKIDPLSVSVQATEICLTTIDSQRRVGFPLCINAANIGSDAEVGPLLLSPTLGFSNGTVWQNQTAAADGRTIPNSKVVFHFFEVTGTLSNQRLFTTLANILHPTAEAANVPSLETVTNSQGAFSINLPTARAAGYRLFVNAIFLNSPTPKSNTLSFKVDSFWQYFVKNTLPKLIILLIFIIFTYCLMMLEAKTRRVSIYLANFNEKRLTPIAVRTRLKLRRLWYNFLEYYRSDQR